MQRLKNGLLQLTWLVEQMRFVFCRDIIGLCRGRESCSSECLKNSTRPVPVNTTGLKHQLHGVFLRKEKRATNRYWSEHFAVGQEIHLINILADLYVFHRMVWVTKSKQNMYKNTFSKLLLRVWPEWWKRSSYLILSAKSPMCFGLVLFRMRYVPSLKFSSTLAALFRSIPSAYLSKSPKVTLHHVT